MMNWIKENWFELCSNWKKLTKIKVEYELTTKSGNDILTIKEEIEPIKPFIRKGGFSKEFDWNREIRDDKEYKKIFNKRAKEVLDGCQKEKRIELNKGWIDCGKYIVGVRWNIWTDYDNLDYKEYLNSNVSKKLVDLKQNGKEK